MQQVDTDDNLSPSCTNRSSWVATATCTCTCTMLHEYKPFTLQYQALFYAHSPPVAYHLFLPPVVNQYRCVWVIPRPSPSSLVNLACSASSNTESDCCVAASSCRASTAKVGVLGLIYLQFLPPVVDQKNNDICTHVQCTCT